MDNAVVSAPVTLTTEMLARASLFRADRVFAESLADDEVDFIDLRCGLPQSFALRGNGFFSRAPAGLIPDQAALSGLADTLLRLRAEAWVADADHGAFGTTASACTATVRTRGEGGVTAHTITLGGAGDGGIYARVDDDPNVLVLPASVRDLLHAIYMDLDVARPHGDVTRAVVTVNAPKTKPTTLMRGDETADVFAALEVLGFDKVVRFGAPLPEDGLAHPWATVELDTEADGGARTHEKISFGAQRGTMTTVAMNGVPAVYEMARARVTAIVGAAKSTEKSDAGAK